MRAAQYGQTHWQVKRRTNNAALPCENAALGRLKPCGYAKLSNGHGVPKHGKRNTPVRYNGRGHVAPMALYGPPLRRVRFKHKKHTKLTLMLGNVSPKVMSDKNHDPWAGRYEPNYRRNGCAIVRRISQHPRAAIKALKKAYTAKYGSLAGPIVTKKQPRLVG